MKIHINIDACATLKSLDIDIQVDTSGIIRYGKSIPSFDYYHMISHNKRLNLLLTNFFLAFFFFRIGLGVNKYGMVHIIHVVFFCPTNIQSIQVVHSNLDVIP